MPYLSSTYDYPSGIVSHRGFTPQSRLEPLFDVSDFDVTMGILRLHIRTGSHEDRHTPFDTADKVDFEEMAEVVGFCEDVIGQP